MIKHSERSAFGYRSKTNALGVDYEGEVASKRGRYFEFPETTARMAASKFAWAARRLVLPDRQRYFFFRLE